MLGLQGQGGSWVWSKALKEPGAALGHGSLWRNTSLRSRWDPELHFSAHRGRPRWDAAEVEAPGKESQRAAPPEGHLGASG